MDWLSQFGTEEEDRVAELLCDALQKRGPSLPAHSPLLTAVPAEAACLQQMAQELSKQQQQIVNEVARLDKLKERIALREVDLQVREEEIEAQRMHPCQCEQDLRDIPLPIWL